ncbi:chitooligosaccharide deacetylase NodB [Krasilnikovia sp. M28-CT-15]
MISAVTLGAAPAAAATARAASKTVYFAFDDGPGEWTPELLAAADAYHAQVTLFFVGRSAEKQPEIVARAAAAGHVIGVHTYSHRWLTGMTAAQVRRELVNGRAALQPYASNCWRPPGWATSPAIEQIGRSLGMRQVLRTVGRTSRRPVFIPAGWTDVDKIVSTVQRTVFDGAVVTLHAERSGNRAQVLAFERLLPVLRARGYRFAPVPGCSRPGFRG